MKFVRKYAWSLYLGYALAEFANLGILQWEFWAIGLPTIVLVALKE